MQRCGRVYQRAWKRSKDSSGAGFACLIVSVLRVALPTYLPICRAEATAVVRASVPPNAGPIQLQAFAQAVPSAWSALPPCSSAPGGSFLFWKNNTPFFRADCRAFLVFPHSGACKQQSHWLVGALACETPLSLPKWRAPLRLHWFQYLLVE